MRQRRRRARENMYKTVESWWYDEWTYESETRQENTSKQADSFSFSQKSGMVNGISLIHSPCGKRRLWTLVHEFQYLINLMQTFLALIKSSANHLFCLCANQPTRVEWKHHRLAPTLWRSCVEREQLRRACCEPSTTCDYCLIPMPFQMQLCYDAVNQTENKAGKRRTLIQLKSRYLKIFATDDSQLLVVVGCSWICNLDDLGIAGL